MRRAIAGSAIGNAVEWYDYGLYAAATGYITAHLTRGGSGGLLITLLGFAISFVLRPLGGFVWGPLGDKLGRKQILSITIILIAGATVLLGLIPSYSTIGVAAPIIMICLRVVQGFSTGGEYGGAATFMAEYASDHKRGFLGSFLEFGTLSGFVLGSGIMLIFQLIFPASFMASWGWRIPFFIALPLGLVGLYLRTQLEDSPVFRELEAQGGTETEASAALGKVIRDWWRPILTLMGLVVALNVVNYTLLSYMPTYLRHNLGLTENQSLIVPIVGELFMMLFIPFAGKLSDHIGRRPSWLISLIGLLVLAIPAYMVMAVNFTLAVIAFIVLGLFYVLQLGTISATFPAMFPTHVRYAGFAVGYNVSTAALGGTAPLVNDWLVGLTGDSLIPAYYMMGACAVGIIAWFFLKETAGASLRGRGVPQVISRPAGVRPAES